MPTSQEWDQAFEGVKLRRLGPSSPPGSQSLVSTSDALVQAGCVEFCRAARQAGAPVTLVLNDAHRMTDTPSFIDAVVRLLTSELDESSRPVLRALVAAGSHRSTSTEREAHEAAIFGEHRGQISECRWHDAKDSAVLRRIGGTTFHEWMAEGGYYLACGSTEPHYFAGATGAHKTLTVGVMGIEDLEANHANAMSPASGALVLEGNPVHEALVASVGDLASSGAHLLVLNQVIVDGRVVALAAGEPLAALAAVLPQARLCFAAHVATEARLVIARVAAPLDRDLYQADKGIKNTETAVVDGGILILDAQCAQGVGIDHFVELLRQAPSHAEALSVVAGRGYRLGDHKAVRLRALTDTRGVALGIVSPGLSEEAAGLVGARIFRSAAAAATWATQESVRRFGEPCADGFLVEDAGNIAVHVG